MIGGMFRTPSSFEGDPLGFLLNQGGHALVVGGGGVALASLAARLPGISAWAVLWLLLALYAVWEASQYLLHDAEGWDCVEDLGFVTCGALAIMQWSATIGLVCLLFLLAGYLRRAGR